MIIVVTNPKNILEKRICIYNNEIIYINNLLQDSMLAELLIVSSEKMLEIIDIDKMKSELSEHTCFVYITEKAGCAILIDTKIPYMISRLPDKYDLFWDNINEWVEICSDYGYECVYKREEPFYRFEHEKKRLNMLVYFGFFPMEYCGSAQHFLGEIEGIQNYYNEIDITIYIPHKAIEKHNIHISDKINIIYSEDGNVGFYDVIFVPYQVWDVKDLYFIKKHTDNYVVWPLDIISLRCAYLKDDFKTSVLKELIETSSGLIFSLQATAADFYDYFKNNAKICSIPYRVISLPTKKHNLAINDLNFPFDRFILVVGNSYKHKMLEQILEVLRQTENSYVVISGKDNILEDNILHLKSGYISDDVMDYLFFKCDMIIFPSIYEGFGLPVLEGINCGKNVIIPDTASNREIMGMNESFNQYMHLYKKISEVPGIINDVLLNDNIVLQKNVYNKNWDEVMRDVVAFIKNIVINNKVEKRNIDYNNAPFLNKLVEQEWRLIVTDCIVNKDFECVRTLKKIDIYGCGNNGKLFYLKVKDKCNVNSFIDKRKNDNGYDGIPIVDVNRYQWEQGTFIIVTPIYLFFEIKHKLIDSGVAEDYILRIDQL